MSSPGQFKAANVRPVFFVSDGTGLTAEAYGKSLLAQFPKLEFTTRTLAFVDTQEKAVEAVKTVAQDKGIDLVVAKNSVIFADDSLEITDAVIVVLNAGE